MLGCSISRFSSGLVSNRIGALPPAMKHGGGVINQLSSKPHAASKRIKLLSSASVSAESRDEQEEQRTVASGGATSSVPTSTRSSSHALEQVFATGTE